MEGTIKGKEPKRGWVKKRREKKLKEFYKPVFLKIGKVMHYYDKLGIAVVKIDGTLVDILKNGDHIRIQGRKTSFGQLVQSMEINHNKVEACLRGNDVGIKVKHDVRKNDVVYVEQNLFRMPSYAQCVINEQLTIDAVKMKKVKRVVWNEMRGCLQLHKTLNFLLKDEKRLMNITEY